MEKLNFTLLAFLTALITFSFTACSDDDEPKEVKVTGVTISPNTLSLQEGTTGTLTATVTPGNATIASVSWSSSNEAVATVESGVVTAVAEGTATITVKTDEGGFTATCEVTVTKEIPPFDESKYHFDLFLTVNKHGGMNSKNTTYFKSVDNLATGTTFTITDNTGGDLLEYSMESISKGKYYYQIPSSADRFVKYQIKNDRIEPIAERPFKDGGNSYKVRLYSYAWIDDNTLVIMACNGEKTKLIWTKLNTTDMSIINEGVLNIDVPEGYDEFTTSGILAYRETDNKLFYFYYGKTASSSPMGANNEPKFRTAVIDATTMALEEKDILAPIDCEMAGSAYGELLQNIVMFDEADNLYLAVFSEEDDIEKGKLLRINAGETHFDSSYNGYKDSDGKLLTVQYLGNGKAFVYARNDNAPVSEAALNNPTAGIKNSTSISAFSHYYAVVDLATGLKTRMSYNGKEIAYSGGRFSQRSVVFNGKVYFGTHTEEDENSIIYIYDIATGTVEKGSEVVGGLYFDMIRVIEND